MALLDNLKKTYKIACKCSNCGNISDINIPKGITITEYLQGERSLCPVCGCNTLNKYDYSKQQASRQQQATSKISKVTMFDKEEEGEEKPKVKIIP